MPDYPNPSSQQVAQLLGSGFGSDLRKRFDIRSSLRGAIPLRTPGASDMQWPGGSAPIASGMGFFPGSTVPLNFPFLPSLFTIGGGGGGGGGSVTINQGTGITVTPNGTPDTIFTIAGAYTASNGVALAGVNFSHAMTAGSNVSSVTADGQINVTDMRPTAGYEIDVSGTQVNWDPRMLWGLFLVNATVNLTSGPPYTITPNVAAYQAESSPLSYWKWKYKCVPIKLLSINTTTGAVSYAFDDDSELSGSLSGATANMPMWNTDEMKHESTWAETGVNMEAGGSYPPGFKIRPLGYDYKNAQWKSLVRWGCRYRTGVGSYEWLIGTPQSHDGTCEAGTGNYFPGGW